MQTPVAVEDQDGLLIPAPQELQDVYMENLKGYPLGSFIPDPIALIDLFYKQEIGVVRRHQDQLKKTIISKPWLNLRIQSFLTDVLWETNVSELLRVRHCLLDANNTTSSGEVSDLLKEIFDSIYFEVAKEAKELRYKAEDFQRMIKNVKLVDVDSVSQTGPNVISDVSEYKSLRTKLFQQIIPRGNVTELESFLLQLQKLSNQEEKENPEEEENPEEKEKQEKEKIEKKRKNLETVWLDGKNTPLHAAAAIARIQGSNGIIDTILDMNPLKDPTAQDDGTLLNRKDANGRTALHIAIYHGATSNALNLIDRGASVRIRDHYDVTAQHLMYQKMPECVIHILNKVCSGPNFADVNNKSLPVQVDFSVLVPTPSESNKAPEESEENQASATRSSDLAQNEEANEKESTAIDVPPSPTVITMSQASQSSYHPLPSEDPEVGSAESLNEMSLLAKIVFKNWRNSYELILSHVLTKCFLHKKQAKVGTQLKVQFFLYLALYLLNGALISLVYFYQFPSSAPTRRECSWKYLAAYGAGVGVLLLGVILYVLVEVVLKLVTIRQLFKEKTEPEAKKKITDWPVVCYVRNLENSLQLLYSVLSIVALVGIIHIACCSQWKDYFWVYHSFAAWSALPAGILALLHLDRFECTALHVAMFKLVLKRFLRVLGVYSSIILGFCVTFSIFFSEDRFLAIPLSFFRALSMLAGDLGYEEVFKRQTNFPWNAQVAFTIFVILVPIVMLNLLVGLAVTDIKEMNKKSEIIRYRVMVCQIFAMEHVMRHAKRICPCIGSTRLNVPKKTSGGGGTATGGIQMKEIPKKLRPEFRLLFTNTKEYINEHFGAMSSILTARTGQSGALQVDRMEETPV